VKYGDDITALFPTVPAREGYTFNGWDSEATTMPASDLTITATWTKDGDEPGPGPGAEGDVTAIDPLSFTKDSSGDWLLRVKFTLAEGKAFAVWAPTVNVYVSDKLDTLYAATPTTLDKADIVSAFDAGTGEMTIKFAATGGNSMFVGMKTE